ncbi:MAG: gliding motility-associated protein GldE [Putridiphycobacter sp.]
METDILPVILSVSASPELVPVLVTSFILILLIFASAMVSGSEVAFFSLNPVDVEDLEKNQIKSAKTTLELLDKPKDLLATILITNNFINISIVILSTYLSDQIFSNNPYKIFIDVVAITFIILLFGEVIPKVYATRNSLKLSQIMATPLKIIGRTFPINIIRKALVSSTSFLSNLGANNKVEVSSDDLEHAIHLTKETSENNEDHKILEGIVKFGSKDVKQIMKPRTEVVAFEIETNYNDIYEGILEAGYSRIPIYRDSFDKIEGVLFVKDLIPYTDEAENFDWQKLIREPYFVPETKKLDDLLQSFQEKKMHMAFIVDEFGGTSGIATLEDVLEEIVGDISDEFDQEDLSYSKLDEHTFVFEGKTPLVDFYRVIDIKGNLFEEAKGESDTLAGFVIEQASKILLKDEQIDFENYTFIVESADKRKINRIKVIINPLSNNDEDSN